MPRVVESVDLHISMNYKLSSQMNPIICIDRCNDDF